MGFGVIIIDCIDAIARVPHQVDAEPYSQANAPMSTSTLAVPSFMDMLAPNEWTGRGRCFRELEDWPIAMASDLMFAAATGERDRNQLPHEVATGEPECVKEVAIHMHDAIRSVVAVPTVLACAACARSNAAQVCTSAQATTLPLRTQMC